MAQEEQSLGDAQARVQADAVTAPGDAQQQECHPHPLPNDAMAQEEQALGDAQARVHTDDVPDAMAQDKQALGDAQASVQADDVPAPGDAS